MDIPARRRADNTDYASLRPGEYSQQTKSITGPFWLLRDPGGLPVRVGTRHQTEAHSDGTLTVLPPLREAGVPVWGWLDRGVWRRVSA